MRQTCVSAESSVIAGGGVRLTQDAAERLGWSIGRGPDRTTWIATRYEKVLIEPTRQRLSAEIARFELRLVSGS